MDIIHKKNFIDYFNNSQTEAILNIIYNPFIPKPFECYINGLILIKACLSYVSLNKILRNL